MFLYISSLLNVFFEIDFYSPEIWNLKSFSKEPSLMSYFHNQIIEISFKQIIIWFGTDACLIVWLSDCLIVWLSDCQIVRLSDLAKTNSFLVTSMVWTSSPFLGFRVKGGKLIMSSKRGEGVPSKLLQFDYRLQGGG